MKDYSFAYRDFGLFLSQEEVDIIRYIIDYWCHWDDIPEQYTLENAEDDFAQLDDMPEGMTVDMLYEIINNLLAHYWEENKEEV